MKKLSRRTLRVMRDRLRSGQAAEWVAAALRVPLPLVEAEVARLATVAKGRGQRARRADDGRVGARPQGGKGGRPRKDRRQVKIRVCLNCSGKFTSEWPGQRICPSCKPGWTRAAGGLDDMGVAEGEGR